MRGLHVVANRKPQSTRQAKDAILGSMVKNLPRWAGFLALDVLIAVVLFFGYFGGYRGLVFVNQGSEHPRWLNVTPGYPDTIPELFQTQYSPWPLPHDQNLAAIAGITLQPGRPVVLKGKPNPTRYWNVVFYPAGADKHNSYLPTLDSSHVVLEPDGTYVITLGAESSEKNWIDTGNASGGLLFMRNYVPTPGETITFPAIYYGDRLMEPAKEYEDVQ
jgi:hypothetical protein